MKPNPLIEEIRAVRHRISEAFGHDTQRLGQHYRELEATKYSHRTFVRTKPLPTGGCRPETGAHGSGP